MDTWFQEFNFNENYNNAPTHTETHILLYRSKVRNTKPVSFAADFKFHALHSLRWSWFCAQIECATRFFTPILFPYSTFRFVFLLLLLLLLLISLLSIRITHLWYRKIRSVFSFSFVLIIFILLENSIWKYFGVFISTVWILDDVIFLFCIWVLVSVFCERAWNWMEGITFVNVNLPCASIYLIIDFYMGSFRARYPSYIWAS